MTQLLSTAEAAAALGISRQRVVILITSGRLRAQRIGRTWGIAPRDLDAVRERKPGRPPAKAK